MNLTSAMIAIAALVALSALPGAPVIAVAHAGCAAGDRIDNTTADQAKRRIEAAGYTNVHDLHKGCDNYWHSMAMKDGNAVRVALSPEGRVLREDD